MLKKLRIITACFFFVVLTLLFCDFTGTMPKLFAPLVQIQFLPALLAGSFVTVAALIVLTFLFGRLYCSTVCPLGILQDLVSFLASKRKKNRFGWQKGKTVCRIFFLVLGTLLCILGIGSAAALLDPFGAFGRIASNLIAPLYRGVNNLMADIAEQYGSFAFYSIEIWIKGIATLAISVVTFLIIVFFAWRWGRLYCNTVCPVGAFLGLIAKFSVFRLRINTQKCNNCGLCAKKCKASCINPAEHLVDMSRCVVCFDCLENCPQKAYGYTISGVTPKQTSDNKNVSALLLDKTAKKSDPNMQSKNKTDKKFPSADKTVRRGFLSLLAVSALTQTGLSQEKNKKKKKEFDGGLAPLVDRILPARTVSPLPPGSWSVRNFSRKCIACQLCVSVCPNHVLRPSGDLKNLMQPVMSFERGYCRPECVKCSEVCPADAIRPISVPEKAAAQIGYAVWVRDACIVITDNVECGNCQRHCPTDAIEMVSIESKNPKSLKFPTVNVEKCIGCGACEHLCPVRPVSAIYVEGMDRQRII